MTELYYQLRWALPIWLMTLATNWLPENRITLRLRGLLVKPFIFRCGRNFQLGIHATLRETNRLTIGDDVYVARGCWLDAAGGLTLEDQVVLGPYVVISTSQHVFNAGSVRFGGNVAREVRVGRGSWLAAHVSVRAGVSVGRGSLVAANAFVADDVADHVVVGGVPATFLKANTDAQGEFASRHERLDKARTDR